MEPDDIKPTRKLTFKYQLIIVFCLGFSLLTGISTLLVSSITANTLFSQLENQGKNITESLAKQSALALLYQSEDIAQKVVASTLAFPDVIHVAIYDQSNELLYQDGDKQISDSNLFVPINQPVSIDQDSQWLFAAPVITSNHAETSNSPFNDLEPTQEQIGYVYVTLTKGTVGNMIREIFRSNTLAICSVAIALLIVLLLIANKITKPLRSLARNMKAAEQGKMDVRAQLSGPPDIAVMESAFNTMMDELEAREEELVHARDAALESARAKGIFAATVSHELRTPMNGVLGMLQLIASSQINSTIREFVETATTSARSLLVLIDDILDFTKIESGKMKLHKEVLGIRQLCQDIIELLSVQASQKGLMLHGIIDTDVPDAIESDAGRLRQVLINLLGNAIKFTHEGEVTLHISRSETNKKQLKFAVYDTGIGIEQKAQRRIFESFVQADGSTTRRYGGTGLGLSICQQLVELMGGQLALDSTPGEGSCFWFYLPLIQPDNQGLETRSANYPLSDVRVLLVGDTERRLATLTRVFESWYCLVDSWKDFHRLRQALDDIEENYDLVVLDTEKPSQLSAELIDMLQQKSEPEFILLSDSSPISLLSTDVVRCLPRAIDSTSLLKAIVHKHSPGEDQYAEPEHYIKEARVLVVEDNRTNQLVAAGMLERLGYEVDLADNGAQALEMFASQPYDIVLMDCHMPVMDGYIATVRIRENEPEDQRIPILAMTAHTNSEDRSRCRSAGMDDYVSKPIVYEELEAKISVWLKKNKEVLYPSFRAESQEPQDDTGVETALDLNKIAELRNKLGYSFSTALKAFIEDISYYQEQLKAHIDDQDFSKAKELAHAVVGSAANVGAIELSQLARQLNQALQVQDQETVTILFSQLSSASEAVKSQLRKQLHLSASGTPLTVDEKDVANTILVVDDDRSTRYVINGALAAEGYAIREVNNGFSALELCKEQMPDIILLDAMMPDMDGFETCRQILKAARDKLPVIIIMTALSDDESIENAFNAGAMDFLPKPLNLTLLKMRINRLFLSQQTDKQVHKLTFYDPLTALPNREFFVDHARELLINAYQMQQLLGLLSIDLDRFAAVNEVYSHDIGDQLLKMASERIQKYVRASDLVARVGGNEFMVMLSNLPSQEMANDIAMKICSGLATPFDINGNKLFVTASIGVATFPHNGKDTETLVQRAEIARSKAKLLGGNCYQLYQMDTDTDFQLQLEFQRELHRAVSENEFVALYQPRARLDNGELIGLEATLRWQHPNRGLLPTREFYDAARQAHLLDQICLQTLDLVLEQMSGWLRNNLGIAPITIGFCDLELSPNLLKEMRERFTRYDVDPQLIVLQLSYNLTQHKFEQVLEELIRLTEVGVKLEVRQTGNHNLFFRYIKDLNINSMLLDQSLINDTDKDSTNKAIVSNFIKLAHELGIKVIADGVANENQLKTLAGLKCDWLQGSMLSRPLTANNAVEWVKKSLERSGNNRH